MLFWVSKMVNFNKFNWTGSLTTVELFPLSAWNTPGRAVVPSTSALILCVSVITCRQLNRNPTTLYFVCLPDESGLQRINGPWGYLAQESRDRTETKSLHLECQKKLRKWNHTVDANAWLVNFFLISVFILQLYHLTHKTPLFNKIFKDLLNLRTNFFIIYSNVVNWIPCVFIKVLVGEKERLVQPPKPKWF